MMLYHNKQNSSFPLDKQLTIPFSYYYDQSWRIVSKAIAVLDEENEMNSILPVIARWSH